MLSFTVPYPLVHRLFARSDMGVDYFDHWEMEEDELNGVLNRNPSLRGMLHGYLAEEKVKKHHLAGLSGVENIRSPDDHDRSEKCDWLLEFQGFDVKLEVKSLQSNHVERVNNDDSDLEWKGKFQCDASDSREVELPNGTKMQTTCLVVGEFDLLAVNLFEFGGQWRFAFAKNEDLPRTPYSQYREEDRQYLIKGTMDITFPLQDPYSRSPGPLLEEIVEEKTSE